MKFQKKAMLYTKIIIQQLPIKMIQYQHSKYKNFESLKSLVLMAVIIEYFVKGLNLNWKNKYFRIHSKIILVKVIRLLIIESFI